LPPEYTPSGLGRVPSATRLWFAAPRHLARQVGDASWSHFIIFLVPMVHVDDVEMTEGVASSTPHASRVPAPGATVPVGQQPLAAARAARRPRGVASIKGPLTGSERRSASSG